MNHKSPLNFKDLSGRTFGRLHVISRLQCPNESGRAKWEPRWLCTCECGGKKVVKSRNLVHGRTLSCGCLWRAVGHRNRTHGQTIGGNTRLYRCWRDVVARCTNSHVRCYSRYGGAGVTICDQWRHDFAAFARDVGTPPSDGLTIDRIDNGRGYEPGNVRWATVTDQARNRRYCKLSVERAADVRDAHARGESYRTIAKRIGCSKSTVAMCCAGQTWV